MQDILVKNFSMTVILKRYITLFADVTEIQKKCNRWPLEGKYLEIGTIDPVKYIVVSAEEDITMDELKEYFQNRIKSNGGMVQRVSLRTDGCFTVKFKHEKGEREITYILENNSQSQENLISMKKACFY